MAFTEFSTQAHIYTVVFTPKLTFTTDTLLLPESTFGGQEAAHDSDVAWILQELLCTQCVLCATLHLQLLSMPQPNLLSFSLQDTQTGLQEAMGSQKREDNVAYSSLSL